VADDGERNRRRSSRFLVALVALIGVAGFVLLKPIVSGVTFGLVVGFLLQRPYQRVSRRLRAPRLVAVGFVALLCIALDVPLFVLGWRLVTEIRGFVDAARDPGFGPSLAHGLVRLGVPPDAAGAFVQQASADAMAWLHGATLPTLGFVGALLMNAGVFLFVLYYTLVSGPRFVKWVLDALPLPERHARHLVEAVADRMRNLFLGTFLVATCLGILSGVAWWLAGFPDPVFWGAVMTVLNLIPALGMGLVAIPAGAIAILNGRVVAGVAILAWAFLLSPLVGNAIRAVFVGKTEGVHPILVLVGTVGGVALFGPAGILLGPLVLSMLDPVLAEWESLREPREGFPHAE